MKKNLKKKSLMLAISLVTLITSLFVVSLAYAQSNSGTELTAATIAGSTGVKYIGSSSSAAKRTVAWTRTAFDGPIEIKYGRNSLITGGCASPDPTDSDWNNVDSNNVSNSFTWDGATIAGLDAATDYCLLIRSSTSTTPWSVTDQFEVDNTVPTITARQTQDLDGDGKIDAMKITFSDEILDSTVVATDFDVAGYAGEAFSSTTNGDVANNNVIYITFTEGGASDTNAIPNVTYTAGALTDLADNALASNGPTASTDLAKPVITIANWLDQDANGTIDRVTLTFSEAVDFTDTGDGFGAILLNDGSAITIDNADYSNTNQTTLTLNFTGDAVASTAITGLTVTYSDAGSNSILDRAAAPLEVLNGDVAESYTDGAKPVFKTSTTADNDGNGTVDQAVIVYSEPVTIVDAAGGAFDGVTFANSCTAAAADYSAVATTTSVVALTGCTAGDTSITADPTYASAAGDISDTVNEMANAETVTGTDGAAPVMLSSIGSDSDDDGKTNSYVITFSENLTDKGAAAANANFSARNYTTTGVITISTVAIGATAGGGATKVTLNLDDSDADNYTGVIDFSYNSAGGGAIVEDASAATNDYANQTNVALTDNVKPVLLSARGADVGGTADVLNNVGEFLEFTFSETMNATPPSIVNLEAGLTFANGATDGTNLGGGTNTVTRTTRTITGDSYRVTRVDTDSTNLITPATDTVVVAVGTNILDLANVTANTNPAAVTVDSADITPPTFSNRETQDLDVNGKIDAIKVTMGEAVVDTTITLANFTTSHAEGFDATYSGTIGGVTFVNGISTGATPNDTVFYLKLAEHATADTDAVPTVTYTAGTLADANANLTVTTGAVAATDKAAPAALSAVYKDATGPDGRVDTVEITFSEAVTLSSYVDGDWSVAEAGTINLVDDTAASAATNVVTLSMLGDADKTGGATNPQITYTNSGGNRVTDGGSNNTATFTVTATDSAAPFYVSSQTLDNNNDGTVDYVKVVYSEAIADSSVDATDFEAGTDAVTDGLLLETFVSGTPTAGGNVTDVANDSTIYIGVTSGSQTLTAKKTDYTLHIIQDGAVTDGTSTLASFTEKTSTDGAAPLIKTVTIEDAASGDGLIDKITFTWSENVDTDNGAAPVFGDLPVTLLPDGQTAVFTAATISDPAGASADVVVTGITGQVTVNTATSSTAISGDLSTMWKDAALTPIVANATGATANESVTDSAKPVFKTSTTADNDGNGTVDQAVIVYSEPVTIVDAAGGAFDGVTFANSCTAAAADYSAVATTTSVVALTGCTAGDTSITADPTYASAAGDISDTVNEMANAETVTGTDGAAPAILTIAVNDANANGKLDTATMTFSENLSDTASGANGFDVSTSGNHGACTSEAADPDGTANLSLTYSCASNDTSITGLNIALTANAGIKDAANNQTVSKTFNSTSSPAVTDSAAPVPLSATITKAAANGDLQTGAVIEVTFSEPVAPGAIVDGNWKFSRYSLEALSAANWPDGATTAYAAGSTSSKVKMTLSAPTTSGVWGAVAKLNLNADNTATITDTSAALNSADKNVADLTISGMVGPVLNSEPVATATTTGATISWTTNANTTANEVKYGTTVAVGSSSTTGTPGEGGTTHSINLSSLSANTLYYYQVCFTNVSQTCTTINHFTTAAASDGAAPAGLAITTADATVNADYYTIAGTITADTNDVTVQILNGSDVVGTVVVTAGETAWSAIIALPQSATTTFTARATDPTGNAALSTSNGTASLQSVVITESTTAGQGNGSLAVTSINSNETYAAVNGGWPDGDSATADGWSWTFNITVPTTETSFAMKFDNWRSGNNTILVADNIRFYSAQASANADVANARLITAASTDSAIITLDGDLDAATAGRQIQVTVEAKIPTGSTAGSYSTQYGITSVVPVR
ncbi:MAG: fibronectin type III domain-containing protein [Patescibacteria group bacterium]|nr:fibronectin type III domain-containing protein [Patescibacteria group bacterium]